MKIREFFYILLKRYFPHLKTKSKSKFFKKILINKILLIFSYYLKISKEEILISDIFLNSKEQEELEKILYDVLIKKYPIEYLLKKIRFGNLELNINENCLVPRLETEEFLFYSFEYLKNKYDLNDFSFIFLELGVGSGNIILNFLEFFKFNKKNIFIGSDISFKAIYLALSNFYLNFIDKSVSKLIYLINSDKFLFINTYNLSKFLITKNLNLIIFSNPPYLDKKEIKNLYDPFVSLYSKDKISFYVYILKFVFELIDSIVYLRNDIKLEKLPIIEVFLEIDRIGFKKLLNKKRNKILSKLTILKKQKISKNIYYFYIKYKEFFININFYVV